VASEQLLGREAELRVVDAFLERAASAADALVIDGEPGIGKAALWSEALSNVANGGTQVLSCRAAQAEAKLSFAGLSDLLEPIPEARFAALPPPERRSSTWRRRWRPRRARRPRKRCGDSSLLLSEPDGLDDALEGNAGELAQVDVAALPAQVGYCPLGAGERVGECLLPDAGPVALGQEAPGAVVEPCGDAMTVLQRAKRGRSARPLRVIAGASGAGATGLEPATSGVTGRRSNQLNYAPGDAPL
jgi:hypothetical protein